MRSTFPLLISMLAVAAVGCSSGDRGDAQDQAGPTGEALPTPASTEAAPAAPAFDPPLEFAPSPVPIGEPWHGQYAVHDAVAYFFDDPPSGELPGLLTSVELATGGVRWSAGVEIGTDDPPVNWRLDGHWSAPAVGEVDGRPWVFATFPAVEVGTGTTADRLLARVLAVDAQDGSEQWTADYDLAELGEGFEGYEHLRLVGITDETLVLTTLDTYAPATIAVDAATGELRWRKSELRAQVADSGMAIGTVQGPPALNLTWSLEAYAAVDGEQVWTSDGLSRKEVDPLGPGIVAFRAETDAPDNRYGVVTRVASSETGDVVASIDADFDCIDDETSVVVCWTTTTGIFDVEDHLAALDRDTGELLWELTEDSSERVVPEVRAARAGVVYVTGPRSVVVLDARTGEDLIEDLASFPGGRVIAGFALVRDGGQLVAYPATG